ncbi:hypothetical protein CDAR_289461 [Caerostris darwini]|uniref:Uncharacterized protein n=1 Tax=Caerostris darwini TaxID=1538125 RepID=A0AAV4WAL0_9ARAC|nr:hypothetical protein CDAR_289461 [Caerostris darwini]
MDLFSCLNGCDLDVDRFFYSIRPGLRDVPRYFGKGLTPDRFFRDWESDRSQVSFPFFPPPHSSRSWGPPFPSYQVRNRLVRKYLGSIEQKKKMKLIPLIR